MDRSEALRAVGAVPLSEMGAELASAACGIPLHNRAPRAVKVIRAFAMVDPGDYAWASRFKWSLNRAGYVRRKSLKHEERETYVYLHREILGLEPGDGVDGEHRDGDPLNCTRSNLRRATRQQNISNKRRGCGGASQHRGVSWDASRECWRAQATVNYRNHFIGRFPTEREAARAAAEFRRQHMPFSDADQGGTAA